MLFLLLPRRLEGRQRCVCCRLEEQQGDGGGGEAEEDVKPPDVKAEAVAWVDSMAKRAMVLARQSDVLTKGFDKGALAALAFAFVCAIRLSPTPSAADGIGRRLTACCVHTAPCF